MTKLEIYREKIDEIDSEIIRLYEQRMEVIEGVINYKIENNIPVLDANRESAMLEKNLTKIQNEQLKKYYISVLQGFLKASKELQTDILSITNAKK